MPLQKVRIIVNSFIRPHNLPQSLAKAQHINDSGLLLLEDPEVDKTDVVHHDQLLKRVVVVKQRSSNFLMIRRFLDLKQQLMIVMEDTRVASPSAFGKTLKD